jgi:hypothetical protein
MATSRVNFTCGTGARFSNDSQNTQRREMWSPVLRRVAEQPGEVFGSQHEEAPGCCR